MGRDGGGACLQIGVPVIDGSGDGSGIEAVFQLLLHHNGNIQHIAIAWFRGILIGDGQQGKLIQGIVVFARRCVNCAVVHRYGRIRNCFKLRAIPLIGLCGDASL